MATAMHADATLTLALAPIAVRNSSCRGESPIARLRLNSTTAVVRAAAAATTNESFSVKIQSEHGRRGEGLTRRETILAGVVTAWAGSAVSSLAFPAGVGAAEVKQTNLPIEEIKKVIEDDYVSRNYLVTGNMTKSVYKDDCRFHDPTTDVTGLQKYSDALKVLFDPSSKSELLRIEVSGPRTVDVKWRLSGFLNFPWHPYIKPYTGSSRYTVDEDGLIESYSEEWDISVLEAFAQFLTPSWASKDAPK
ncbi:hypothetical protein MPTK1_4g11570 [Marchantia polymorpha subsp. ruderalis]|uniref:Uncharacterized protein n=2 Tax=Marchantia polymorpha TaxID=3197 RepID=A0A176WGH4_MARPO|nr:hypothetical protein AXG93_1962s1030 [Marchantia polymorpha subsp. ruderalis]PTQ46471.1 hypothetical protein MARPO_0011s0142 [Marchantia polymorpha]BBN08435.1 hypothetical protein Mp_4g11570 [Marchantia polymorpha subsp. ruderalis]|eukprot:PTQ46471.1 hypothetical protein MARPO_0011s0142 [Marchantia polymorpha]